MLFWKSCPLFTHYLWWPWFVLLTQAQKFPKLSHPPSLVATHQPLCQPWVPNNIIKGEEKILYRLADLLAWVGSDSFWLQHTAFQTQSVFKIPGPFQVQEKVWSELEHVHYPPYYTPLRHPEALLLTNQFSSYVTKRHGGWKLQKMWHGHNERRQTFFAGYEGRSSRMPGETEHAQISR